MSLSVLERKDSFADSDADRRARPLKYAKRATLTQPLDLELGGRLSGVPLIQIDKQIALGTGLGQRIVQSPNLNADLGIFALRRQ